MVDINELRRLTQAALTGPDGVSLNWVKLLQDFQQAASPTAVLELLDRIEAAEKDIALKERIIDSLGSTLNAVANVRDALRAKVTEMEKQEPVAAQHRFRHPHKNMPNWTVWWPCEVSNRPAWEVDAQGYEVEYRALYLATGAQEAKP